MYYTAVEEGFLFQYDEVLQQHTRIRDVAKKVLMLAAELVVGPKHPIPLHNSVEKSEKEKILGGKEVLVPE